MSALGAAQKLLERAEHSPAMRRLLDLFMSLLIPFNRPHRLSVRELSSSRIVVRLPYRRRNWNHLRGLHACGLATAAEYASGLLLLRRLGAERYRLIMKSLKVDYTYQGKSSAAAVFELDEAAFQQAIAAPLEKGETVIFEASVPVYDEQQNLLCTAAVTWQIKSWQLVRTAA